MNVDEFIKDWLTQKNIIVNKIYEIPHHLLKTMLLEFHRLMTQEERGKNPPGRWSGLSKNFVT